MTIKRMSLTALALVALVVVMLLVVTEPTVLINNHRLKTAIRSVKTDSVSIGEVVPFKWTAAYAIKPSQTKNDIEAMIGIKSRAIRANTVSEGMVHVVFVNDKQVVASVLGYPKDVGYTLGFQDKIAFSDNAVFLVERKDGIVALTRQVPTETAP